MRQRVRQALVLGGLVAGSAVVVTTVLTSHAEKPASQPIQVPQVQGSGLDSGLDPSKVPSSTISAIPPFVPAPPETSTAPPSSGVTSPSPPRPSPPPPPRQTPRPAGVDFQAENALINKGRVASDTRGFTGTGFVDTDNTVGSFVQWTVNANRTDQVDVTFRFANGSGVVRPMDITVNGILIGTINFGFTNGFEDYRTITIPVNLLGGTNKIRATSKTGNGGPNLDKITVS